MIKSSKYFSFLKIPTSFSAVPPAMHTLELAKKTSNAGKSVDRVAEQPASPFQTPQI